MSGTNLDQVKCSSLSPDVMPFTPRKQPYAPSNGEEQTQTYMLSANVTEFVPSWLRTENGVPSQDSYPTNSKATDCSNSLSQQLFTKKKTSFFKSDNGSDLSTSQTGPFVNSVKKSSTNNDKKKGFLIKPSQLNNKFILKEKECVNLTQIDTIGSEFPALRSTGEQDQGSGEKSSVFVKTPSFAVSFSEKLRSSNHSNTGNLVMRDKSTDNKSTLNKHGSSSKHCFESKRKDDCKKNKCTSHTENKRLTSSPGFERGRDEVGIQTGKQPPEDEHIVRQARSDDSGFQVVQSKVTRRTLGRRERNDESDKIGVEKSSLNDKKVLKPGYTHRAGEHVNYAHEDELNFRGNSDNRTKRFSENRNMNTQRTKCRTKEQLLVSASHKGRSSDTDWRKRLDKTMNNGVGKQEREGNVESKTDQVNGARAGQVSKPEKSVANYSELKSILGIQNASRDKTGLKNNQTKAHKGSQDSEAVKMERDQYKIKITVGKSKVESTLTCDAKTKVQLSYSDILKAKPKLQLPDPAVVEGKERGVLRISKEESDEHELSEPETSEAMKKKKKKKKKKKPSETPVAVKKTKEPLMFNFGDMFAKLEENSSKRKKVIRAGGLMPAQAQLPPKESKVLTKPKADASNPLDSTAPIVLHRKERETPKKKKPSAMRKILVKEREEKKMLREGKLLPEEMQDDGNTTEECEDIDDEEPEKSFNSFLDEVKKSIHSRKFREYCDHDLDYDINGLVIALLRELIRFQDRLYQKDPIKAKAKRRFVCGLREVFKHLKLKRLKCVIVTPNMEPTKSKGGLDDLLSDIIDLCHSQNVPVVFSLNRQVLGKVLLKKVPVSMVGIFYYDGAQNYFKNLMELTKVARETYQIKFETARQKFLSEKKLQTSDAAAGQQEHESIEVVGSLENKQTIESRNDDEVVRSGGTEDDPTELGTSLPFTNNCKSDVCGRNEDNVVVNRKMGSFHDDEAVLRTNEMVVPDGELDAKNIAPESLYPQTNGDVAEHETDSESTKSSKSHEANMIDGDVIVNKEVESFSDDETEARNIEMAAEPNEKDIILADLELEADELNNEYIQVEPEGDANLFDVTDKSATKKDASAV